MQNNRKEEFTRLMDGIVNLFLQKSADSDVSGIDMTALAKDLLNILLNLNQQIEEMRTALERLEDREKRLDRDLKLLIQELKDQGYLNIGERRKLLKRTIIAQDALINILIDKGVIRKNILIEEIKKVAAKEVKTTK